MTYVVAIGSAFDGITLHGPFESAEQASAWAEGATHDDWHIVALEPVTL